MSGSNSADEYEDKLEDVISLWRVEQMIAIIPILIFLVPLIIYLVKNNHMQRFEITIVVLILLKYIFCVLNQVLPEKLHSDAFDIIFFTIWNSFSPIAHWIFASQYLKTCALTQDIVKKALLLLGKYRTLIETKYDRNTMIR